jgi:hypothetical protein
MWVARTLVFRITISLTVMIFALSVNATSTKSERRTLKNLKGIFVVVEQLHQGNVAIEIPTREIQKDVERVLEKAGLSTQNQQQAARKEGNILAVTLAVMHPPEQLKQISDLYVYTVEIALRQRVFLVRMRWVKTSAITWISADTGVARGDNLHESIRLSVALNLEKFLEDYQQVND